MQVYFNINIDWDKHRNFFEIENDMSLNLQNNQKENFYQENSDYSKNFWINISK